jgi:hypothetical protein
MHVISDCVSATKLASEIFYLSRIRDAGVILDDLDLYQSFWVTVRHDADYLTRFEAGERVDAIVNYSLWDHAPVEFHIQRERLEQKLIAIDSKFSNWIDWLDRRIRGEHYAFDIPGDFDGKQNEAILIHLADASNEDFWDKGTEFVNANLQGWIDEALARLAASLPQDLNATAYAVNTQDKVDRLPAGEQQQLRDTTSQREKYADLREAVEELASRGQRLGDRLNRAMPRIAQSLPENFHDAEAYPLWRDANRLRRIYRAHRIAAKSDEFDDAKLDPVVAEDLGGLVDLYSLYSLGDDSLRAMDEATIPPQEREDGPAQAKLAAPVVDALLEKPGISTPIAFDDLISITSDNDLSNDDPYSPQVLAHNNKTISNYVAAVLSGAFQVLKTRPGKVGAALAIGGATGAGNLAGKEILGHFGAIVEFVILQAPILKAYAATVFASHPVPALIDDLIARFGAIFR